MKNVQKIIGTTESMTVEWKPSLSQMKDIIESSTAFANTEGGRKMVSVLKKNGVSSYKLITFKALKLFLSIDLTRAYEI